MKNRSIAFVKTVVACVFVHWLIAPLAMLSAQESVIAAQPDAGQPPQARGPNLNAEQLEKQLLNKVGALLASRCMACHGAEKQEGSYSVASLANTRLTGDSEKQPIVPGKPSESELLRRLMTQDESERMPAEADPLSTDQIELIRGWIAGGARSLPEVESSPLSQWVTLPKKQLKVTTYPRPLPIAALALHPHQDPHQENASTPVATVSGYGEVIDWDLSTGLIKQRRNVAGTQIADIEVSRDGRYLAVSSGTPGTQGFVEVWSLDVSSAGPAIWTSTAADVAADIAFSPNTSQLAVGRHDGSLLVLELKSAVVATAGAAAASGGSEEKGGEVAAVVHTFTPHADAVLAVAWSESSERLITASRDRTAKIFDAREMGLIANYDRHQRAVGGVAYLGDNPVSFDETGQLRLWTGDDNDRTLAEKDGLPRVLEHIVSSGQQLLMPDGADLRVWTIERQTVPDGKDDAGKDKSKKVTRWSESPSLPTLGRDWILCLSANADLVAVGTEAGEVIVWQKGDANPKYRFIAKP